jgi:hypothetical protein
MVVSLLCDGELEAAMNFKPFHQFSLHFIETEVNLVPNMHGLYQYFHI